MNLHNLIEKFSAIIFNNRKMWLIIFAILTAGFAISATGAFTSARFLSR